MVGPVIGHGLVRRVLWIVILEGWCVSLGCLNVISVMCDITSFPTFSSA